MIECPSCGAMTSVVGSSESESGFRMTLYHEHHEGREQLAEEFDELDIEGLRTVLGLTFYLRAPWYFWIELMRFSVKKFVFSSEMPLDSESFAHPVPYLLIDEINEAYEDGDYPRVIALLPACEYREGVISMTYAELDGIVRAQADNPLYEWQAFLQAARREITHLDMCPALEALKEDPDLL